MIKLKIISKIYFQIINYLIFKKNHVIHKKFLIRGYIRIYREAPLIGKVPEKNIFLGEGFGCNSGLKYNPIGGDNCTILRTIDNGIIKIGNHVGISNAALVAWNFIEIEDNVTIGNGVKIYDSDFHSLDYETRVFRPYEDILQDDYTSFYKHVYALDPLHSYYLMGVWANENYLKGIEEELRAEFVFNNNGISLQNERFIFQMRNSDSVAVHVRRNDYITLGLPLVCDEYYKKAIEYIQSKVKEPVFYIFSDDHEYCEQLFKDIDHQIVKGNTGKDSFRDMQLMSCCKHNIIANSTFSFWGAYLNQNINKIVIAPNISCSTCRHPFACESWIKMEA